MDIRIDKEVILNLPMSYAINFLHTPTGMLGVCASEGLGGCFTFPVDTLVPVQRVWENAGGCMSISQIAPDGTFLAVQNFFKGFNAKQGCIVRSAPDGRGGWHTEPFLTLPYLHRFDVIDVEGRKYLIAATLCRNKEFKEDWSTPGAVYIGELRNGMDPPEELRPLIPALTKNHGFYRGTHNGQNCLLISGMEGVFEIGIPQHAGDEWQVECLLEREISDAAIVDIDGDGAEELVAIEGFHGDHITINKLIDGAWQEVYRYPAPFAHVVWGGDILGKPGLLLAYRNDNGGLLLMRRSEKTGAYYMEHLYIDELVSPTNLAVDSRADVCRIYASCGRTQQVVRYTLTRA